MKKNFEIFVILVGVSLTASDHSVQFLSTHNYDQLVTSSTLRWISGANGKAPKNAVVGATRHSYNETKNPEDNIYICRAMHDAEWIPGQLLPEEKACYISLLGLVKPYNTYEVLQNVDNGSRLIWTDWDAYQRYPSGIVAGGIDLYIARKKLGEPEDNDVSSQVDESLKSLQGYSHYVGKFNSKEAFGRMSVVTEEKQEKRFIKGQLLVESEPVRYELNNVRYTVGRRRIKKEKKILAFATLRNDENIPLKADSMLAYDSSYSSYWGQGNAMLKGLTTVIRNATTGNIIAEIEWGIEESEERKDVYKVEAMLEPGTAVNVTLQGNETNSELSYTGTLISFYVDGATTSRKIEGSRRLVQMLDVKPIFGSVFFTQNNSLVPTTTTPKPIALVTSTEMFSNVPEHRDISNNKEFLQNKSRVAAPDHKGVSLKDDTISSSDINYPLDNNGKNLARAVTVPSLLVLLSTILHFIIISVIVQ